MLPGRGTVASVHALDDSHYATPASHAHRPALGHGGDEVLSKQGIHSTRQDMFNKATKILYEEGVAVTLDLLERITFPACCVSWT